MFQLQTDFNILLISINISELLMSSYGIPVDFIASVQLGWKMGQFFCQLTGFLLTFLGKARTELLL